jgi:hypothetical protein
MGWLVFDTPRLLYRRERDPARKVDSRRWLDGCGKSRPPVAGTTFALTKCAMPRRKTGGVAAFETSTRVEDATDHRSPLSSGMEDVVGRVAYQWPRQRNAEVKPDPTWQTRTISSETEQSV